MLDALYHIDTHRHLFNARELVALRYAEIVTTSGGDVDENLWDELQLHFDDDQLVEITTVIGLFNFFNRFADAQKMMKQMGFGGKKRPRIPLGMR